MPLVAPGALADFGGSDAVALANPLRADESVLRTALVPRLLSTVVANAARGRPDVALFELGTVFSPPAAGEVLPIERTHVGAVLSGVVARRPLEPDRPVDVADGVDLLRVIADAIGLDAWEIEPAQVTGYHPGRTAHLTVAGTAVGHAGEVAAAALGRYQLAPPVVAMELDVTALADAPRRDRSFQVPSPFPPSQIDLDFVVDEAVPAARIASTLRAAVGPVLEHVNAFDEFRGAQVGTGKKSLAFALRFRTDHTLTQDEVAALRQRGIDAVTREHGATLRG